MTRARESVTTFIPSRSLDDYQSKPWSSSSPGSSSGAAFRPNYSRRSALVRLILDQEGREGLLQLLQSTSLLLYSFAPNRVRQRQLNVLSEGISNTRKLLLVGRWLAEGSSAVQEQLRHSTKGIIIRDVNGLALDKVDPIDEKSEGSASDGNDEEQRSAEADQDAAVSAWSESIKGSVRHAASYLSIGAEMCDLLAFFGGSGMLWRIMGGKMAPRQRRGLERIALYLAFFSMICGMLHLQQQRRRQLKLLREANARLLDASDKVEDADPRMLLQGHELLPEQVLSSEASPRQLSKTLQAPAQGKLTALEGLLRRSEHRVFLEKKRLDHLKLERTALRSELFFVLIELLWPRYDHSRLEGYTGIVASICNISRLAGESRWDL